MPAGWDFGARVADATALRRLDVEGDGRHRAARPGGEGGAVLCGRASPHDAASGRRPGGTPGCPP